MRRLFLNEETGADKKPPDSIGGFLVNHSYILPGCFRVFSVILARGVVIVNIRRLVVVNLAITPGDSCLKSFSEKLHDRAVPEYAIPAGHLGCVCPLSVDRGEFVVFVLFLVPPLPFFFFIQINHVRWCGWVLLIILAGGVVKQNRVRLEAVFFARAFSVAGGNPFSAKLDNQLVAVSAVFADNCFRVRETAMHWCKFPFFFSVSAHL